MFADWFDDFRGYYVSNEGSGDFILGVFRDGEVDACCGWYVEAKLEFLQSVCQFPPGCGVVMSGNPGGTRTRVFTRKTRVYPGNRVIFFKEKR
jgi:hypothetical protein